jgi:hypothetical protein
LVWFDCWIVPLISVAQYMHMVLSIKRKGTNERTNESGRKRRAGEGGGKKARSTEDSNLQPPDP